MNNEMILDRSCPECGISYKIAVDKRRYLNWRQGGHIQDCFPEMSAGEREQLMTGVCSSECWNYFTGGEDDED